MKSTCDAYRAPCTSLQRFVIVFLYRLTFIFVCYAPIVAPLHAAGQRDATVDVSEDRIKAAYLFRFISYIDWPPRSFAQSASPYVIGVVSEDYIARELSRISQGKTINGRPVIVKKVFFGEVLTEFHLLYIGHEENSRLPRWMKAASGMPLLTVTESRDAIGLGGMVNFRIVDDYVRFEVGLDAIERSGLAISSRMLAVAHSVAKGGER